MLGEGLPVQAATRVLDVTDSGYYAWRSHGLSPMAVRHALVTERHSPSPRASRGSYGYRRIHVWVRARDAVAVAVPQEET